MGYITPSEAAQRAGVSRTAIYNAIADKRLPATRILQRVAILEEDLQKITFLPRNGQRRGMKLGARKNRLKDSSKIT